MRPEEVVELREGEIGWGDQVWEYVPRSHKTEHHDTDRMICIGPQAQKIITPLLRGEPDCYVFRPADAVTDNHQYGERYSVDSYRCLQMEIHASDSSSASIHCRACSNLGKSVLSQYNIWGDQCKAGRNIS